MGDFEPRRRVGRHGTDLLSFEAVEKAVAAKIRRQWGGWSLADRQDLQQQVMIKYFDKFGRIQLEQDDDGKPVVQHTFLNTVVRNAGIDFDRRRRARPADAADFQGEGAHALEWLLQEANAQRSLSSDIAANVDIQRKLFPALSKFSTTNPLDMKLIVWRHVEGREVEAIAKILGRTPAATKIAIRRAVTRLQQLVLQGD